MGDTRDSDDFLRAVAHAPERRPPEQDVDAAQPLGVAHFRVIARVGSGGMGVVYRAEDEKLRRTVALKVLLPAYDSDAEHHARFLREARAVAAIKHPNVATIYEVGEADGCAYLAMEYIDGTTLRQLLAAGPMAVGEAVRVATQIAQGLRKAHERGIVHRDLKPENVMLDDERQVKVLDFGIAKRQETEASQDGVSGLARTVDRPTRAGHVLGTPGYMAPEQARGASVDARADLFSLGVILHEALAGQPPFRGETGFDVLMATSRDEPTPLTKLRPEVPRALEALVQWCLAKSPDARIPSAQAVLEALEQLGARPGESPLMAPARRRPARLYVGTVALGLALGAAVAVGRRLGAPSIAISPTTASTPAPAPTAITERPPPRTSSPEAAAAYAAAMQSLRDANIAASFSELLKAVELDPRFSAAHLQLAVGVTGSRAGTLDDSRAHLQAAQATRALLDDRDAELLRVTALRLEGDVDASVVVRESQALAARYPLDADLARHLGDRFLEADRTDEALAAYQRATELDPQFALGWSGRAAAQWAVGDLDGAQESASRCVAIAPSSATCRRDRFSGFVALGQCDRHEAEARSIVAVEPRGPFAYLYLANALVASGAPIESVREALHQRTEVDTQAKSRADSRVEEDELPAMVIGDFVALRAAAMRREALVASDTSEGRHIGASFERGVADIETGDTADLTAIADAYANRLPAWTADDMGARGYVLGVRRRAGHITAAELEQSRAASIAELRRRAPSSSGAWLGFYAIPAETTGEALDALAALPAFFPIPPHPTDLAAAEATGRVYLLAGNAEQALPHLRVAARVCPVLDGVWQRVRASEELGEALEATGDRAGACAAFARVSAWWGHAKPRSLTADKARKHAKGLGCER